jgi:hypothetical protein
MHEGGAKNGWSMSFCSCIYLTRLALNWLKYQINQPKYTINPNLINFQECFAMHFAILGPAAGVILYSTGIALVCYLYVLSSFKNNIEKVIKRDHFVVNSILVRESINFLSVGAFYFQMGDTEMEKSPMMLYHACLNPWNDHTIPVYEIMPWNQYFLVFLAATNVACNLFLYRFLDKVTENSSA